jgi:hypothetical protein
MERNENAIQLSVAASFMAFDESAWPAAEDTDGSTTPAPVPPENPTQNPGTSLAQK